MKVLSGGVLVLSENGAEKTVRMAGIWAPGDDAPEAAKESRDDISHRVLNWSVRLVMQPEIRGEPPAALVYLEADKSLLNELVVRDGFAFVDRRGKREFYTGRLEIAEDVARAKMAGLWGPVDVLRRSPAGLDAERYASEWLKVGDNLKASNPNAAKGWYERVVKEQPGTAAAAEARKRLGVPGPEWKISPLDSETALLVLPMLRPGQKISRPLFPATR